MIQTIFGDFSNGRVGRMQFFGYTLLIAFVVVGTAMAMGFGVGITERIFGRTEVQAHAQPFGLIGLLLFLGVSIAAVVGTLNLVAKRARDMGANVLLMLALYVLFSGVMWFVLVFWPTENSSASA